MTLEQENILRSVVDDEPCLFLTDSSARSAGLNGEWLAADSDEERERIYRDMQLSTM